MNKLIQNFQICVTGPPCGKTETYAIQYLLMCNRTFDREVCIGVNDSMITWIMIYQSNDTDLCRCCINYNVYSNVNIKHEYEQLFSIWSSIKWSQKPLLERQDQNFAYASTTCRPKTSFEITLKKIVFFPFWFQKHSVLMSNQRKVWKTKAWPLKGDKHGLEILNLH